MKITTILLLILLAMPIVMAQPQVSTTLNTNESLSDVAFFDGGLYAFVVANDCEKTTTVRRVSDNLILTTMPGVGYKSSPSVCRTYSPHSLLLDERNEIIYYNHIDVTSGGGLTTITSRIYEVDVSNIGSITSSIWKQCTDVNPGAGNTCSLAQYMDDTYFYYTTNIPTMNRVKRGDNTNESVVGVSGTSVLYDNVWRMTDEMGIASTSTNTYQFTMNGGLYNGTKIGAIGVVALNSDVSNLKGMTSAGKKVYFTDLDDETYTITTLGCNNFQAIIYNTDSNIFGVNTATNKYAYCNFVDDLNPTVNDYSLTANVSASGLYNSWEDIQTIEYWTDDYPISVTNLFNTTAEMVLAELTGTGTGNTAPVYYHEFLGLDEDGENFVFRLSMQDLEGGSVFYAQQVGEAGSGGNTSYYDSLDFNDASNMVFVSNDYCPDSYNLTIDSPFAPFGTDGLLLINQTDCLWPTKIDQADIAPGTTNRVEIATSMGWGYETPPGAGYYISSWSVYDANDNQIFQLLFDMDFLSNNMNISLPNGTIIGNTTSLSTTRIYSISGDIDFDGLVVTLRMADEFGDLFVYDLPFGSEIGGVGYTRYNSYSSTDLLTYIDFSSYYYQTELSSFPTYLAFGSVAPNAVEAKAVYRPVASEFGDYTSLMYGTDSVLGTSYYEAPHQITFTYDSNTPRLTLSEINNIILGSQVIEGDFITDLLPTFIELMGFKSQSSKFVLGLFIVIAMALVGSVGGTFVAMFAAIITMVILAIPAVGLWPVWIIPIMVILAAAFIGIAIRKSIFGGNA